MFIACLLPRVFLVREHLRPHDKIHMVVTEILSRQSDLRRVD
jgi:hypothetical protein